MQKIVPPSEEELDKLLFEKLWSKREISKHYGVSLPTISKWMKMYDMMGMIPPKLRAKKAQQTMKNKSKKPNLERLFQRATRGEKIKVPGFNSDFLEEYQLEEFRKEGYFVEEHLLEDPFENDIFEEDIIGDDLPPSPDIKVSNKKDI